EGCARTLMPPWNCANTGTPASPTTRYSAVARAPRLGPRIPPARATPKVCRVMGTAMPPSATAGARASAAMRAAKVAIKAIPAVGEGTAGRAGAGADDGLALFIDILLASYISKTLLRL